MAKIFLKKHGFYWHTKDVYYYSPFGNMDDSDKCTICLNVYTVAEVHRPTSLECGHLFGNSCIKKWFNRQKLALCPTCTKKCRLRNLRPIYATKIVVREDSEMTEKIIALQEEKKKIEMENVRLLTLVELLQNELKRNEKKCVSKNAEISTYKFLKKYPFMCKERNVLVEYDSCENVILMSFCEKEAFGVRKIDAINLSNTDICFQKRLGELYNALEKARNVRINDLKVSPFNDGTVVLCYQNIVCMLNIANGSILVSLSFQQKITSVAYDYDNRNIIYAGDIKGYLYKINLVGDVSKEQISEHAIHSLHKTGSTIFGGCIDGVYVYNHRIEKYDVRTVTNLSGDKEDVIVTVRDASMMIMHILIDKCTDTKNKDGCYDNFNFNKHIFNFREDKRLRDRIFNKSVFIINNEKQALVVYDVTGNIQKIFWCSCEILGFCLGIDKIFILTTKGFIVYGS